MGVGIWNGISTMDIRNANLRAHSANVAVYDTLFVELAARKQVPLATFDGGLLKAFPSIAARLGSLLPT